jgi:PilZ domain
MSLFRLQRKPRELRRSPRHDVHYLCEIEPGDGTPPFNGILSNISATGAKITVGAHEVADEFTLVFKRRCRVLRRTDGQLGVKFIPS